jgi:SpoVK/Ycf46/Vps4 family AAA+-type ATPase
VSGGLSGAELIGACRDAALLAMEEYEEEKVETNTDPIITMDQLLQTLVNTERQITPSMLEFYASFRSKPKAG